MSESSLRKTPLSNEELQEQKYFEFQIIDWFIPENDKVEKGEKRIVDYSSPAPHYDIIVYGVDEQGNSVCTRVTGFSPYFYVKPPPSWDTPSKLEHNLLNLREKLENCQCSYTIKYTSKSTNEPAQFNKSLIDARLQDHVIDFKLTSKLKDFWGFNDDKEEHFIKIEMKSLALFNELKSYFKSRESEGFVLYESNIEPFLRFMHKKKIESCGWVRIKNFTINEISRCNYNFEVKYKYMTPVEKSKIAPLIIASFDIECTSSHGDFPLPKKDYRKLSQDLCNLAEDLANTKKDMHCDGRDIIIPLIVNAFKKEQEWGDNTIHRLYVIDKKAIKSSSEIIKQLEKIIDNVLILLDDYSKSTNTKEKEEIEARLSHLLTSKLPKLQGDPVIQIGTTFHRYGSDEIIKKHVVTLNSCDEIDGVEVVAKDTERAVILEWKKLIQETDPDIITGFNINGFDFEYIDIRCRELGIHTEFKEDLGRLFNRSSPFISNGISSSALGDVSMKHYYIDGVLVIDVFGVCRRDMKLDSYKLDNIAGVILGEHKNDLKPSELFERYLGNSYDRKVIAEYCIQDCVLVNRLMHKLKILENNMGMANVCFVPLSYIFNRGQSIKIFSLVAYECMQKNQIIPAKKDLIDDDEAYEGAIVLEPEEGIYLDDPITVFDYSSLYPSSMISENLSHDCFIMNPEKWIDKNGNLKTDNENVFLNTIEYDIYETVNGKKKKTDNKQQSHFVKYKDGRKGTIPLILEKLISKRKTTRKKIEYKTITVADGKEYSGHMSEMGGGGDGVIILKDVETGEVVIEIPKNEVLDVRDTYDIFEQAVLDAMQLAYKVTANSLYGQTGAKTSAIYLKDIAASTTATGRNMIIRAKDFVEANYDCKVIYGDTDSIFCKFNLKDENGDAIKGKESVKYAIKKGIEVEKEIAKKLLYKYKPQALNYEKVLYPFIIFSKKRYVGNLYEFDENKYKQKSMGIVLKRRDNANIVKDIFGGIINTILDKQDLQGSIQFLKDSLEELVNGRVSLDKLIISKTLKRNYADPTKIAHKVLADRITARDPGNKPAVNDRIPYIYIKTDNPLALQGERIETPDYIKENNLIPDYYHYINNQIMKPVLQLYSLCVDQLPNYNEAPDYWDSVEVSLFHKEIYTDDDKRLHRMTTLKERKVQNLLFDYYLDLVRDDRVKKRGAGGGAKRETIVCKIEDDCIIDDELNVKIAVKAKTSNKTIDVKMTITDKKNKVLNEIQETGVETPKNQRTIELIRELCATYPKCKLNIRIMGNTALVKKYNESLLFSKETEGGNYEFDIGPLKGALNSIMFQSILGYHKRLNIF
jgi:DNA polymerase elongation subunit (family B)